MSDLAAYTAQARQAASKRTSEMAGGGGKGTFYRDTWGMIAAIHSFLFAALVAEPARVDGLIHALDRLAVAYDEALETEASDDGREAAQEDYSSVAASIGRRFPTLGMYGVVSNPLQIPPESPVIGDAVDDVADIVIDLSEVLWWNSAAGFQEACWHFRFSYEAHWGKHLHDLRTYLHACRVAAA